MVVDVGDAAARGALVVGVLLLLLCPLCFYARGRRQTHAVQRGNCNGFRVGTILSENYLKKKIKKPNQLVRSNPGAHRLRDYYNEETLGLGGHPPPLKYAD